MRNVIFLANNTHGDSTDINTKGKSDETMQKSFIAFYYFVFTVLFTVFKHFQCIFLSSCLLQIYVQQADTSDIVSPPLSTGNLHLMAINESRSFKTHVFFALARWISLVISETLIDLSFSSITVCTSSNFPSRARWIVPPTGHAPLGCSWKWNSF